jgi:hypothetical protein
MGERGSQLSQKISGYTLDNADYLVGIKIFSSQKVSSKMEVSGPMMVTETGK